MVNLIATIPGARKERIAIAGHYDTKLFREFRFVGANDGGSSTAFLIELARVLKARTNAFTIELIFFDGEEATLRDWGTNRSHLRQPALRRCRAQGGHVVDVESARAGRHDRRSLAAIHARKQLDAMVDRYHLVDGAEDGPRVDLRERKHADRGRSRSVSQAPAWPRPTSSTSTTLRGTPRPTRSTRRRRGPCRLWVMWWSRRSRRSRLGCHDEDFYRRLGDPGG